jgi:broad specificity phosphatase PhoE
VSLLEVRRHAQRKTSGGSQLSQPGIDLARSIGSSIGPFATVVTSVVPRARETAIAMGFAVDYELVTLASDPEVYVEAEESEWWRAPHPFVALAEVIAQGGGYYRYAHSMAALWRDLLTPLSHDQAALVIGHSGELEAALIACLPDGDYSTWGTTFGSCEGARLHFDGDPPYFRQVEFLRVPSE